MRAEDAEITIDCKDNMINPGTRKSRAVFSTPYGAVRVYTRRHINGCALISTDDNSCLCPKWIYSMPRGGTPSQKAANTPNFTEACGDAQRILEGFAPAEVEIASELSQSQAPGKFSLSSLGGAVRVYTRCHINGCVLIGARNNRCSCPKWIYSKPTGARARQMAAKTGSFTEACRIAEKILENFERPIAASDLIPASRRPRGRPRDKTTEARIRLAACLLIEELSPSAIRNQLFPGYADADARRDVWKKFYKRNKKRIDLYRRQLTGAPAERDAIKAESLHFIHKPPQAS
jgi:hypothetical protein